MIKNIWNVCCPNFASLQYLTVINCVRVQFQKLDKLSVNNDYNNNDYNNNNNNNHNNYDNDNYNTNLNILLFDIFRITYSLFGNTSSTTGLILAISPQFFGYIYMDNQSSSGYGYRNYKNPSILDDSFTRVHERWVYSMRCTEGKKMV